MHAHILVCVCLCVCVCVCVYARAQHMCTSLLRMCVHVRSTAARPCDYSCKHMY